MSYNGSGTFVINSAGTPYVSGTVISSTAANALNNDLATGLTTAITKDGQTTPTANIPLGGFKITNLGAGTVASDAARLSQVQNSGTTTLISITGTDTITGTVSPTLTAYTAGQVFSFVVAATNTGAVTLNVDSIGVKSVTRTGAVALVAGDMVINQVAVVEFDGTRFQLINGNSFSNLNVSGTLAVTGATTVGGLTVMVNGPAFSAYSASSQSVTTDTFTKITFGTEVFDTNSNFASSRFTPTVAGYYQINGILRATGTSMTGCALAIYKNGAQYAYQQTLFGTTLSNAQLNASEIISMNGSTDYVELYGYITATSPSFDFVSTVVNSRFNSAMVRSA